MGAELKRELIHRGRKFDFERVTFPGADGRTATLEIVRHPGAVVVLPLAPDGKIALIRNERPAVGEALWELPAGTLEAGEPPAHAARRELTEEAGYEAESIEPLAKFYTTPGMTDELMRAFVARGLTHVGQRLEQDERIVVELVDDAEALAMVERGELMDAKSMITLLLAHGRGVIPRSIISKSGGA